MSKNKEIAGKVFKENPTAKKVYVTSDGNPFLSENAANLHATSNVSKKTLTVSVFIKSEFTQGKEKVKVTALERIAKIEAMETVEEIQKAMAEEKATTVLAAAKKRIEAITLANKSGSNDPITRGNEIEPIKAKEDNEVAKAQDYTAVAKYHELMQFANDNKVALDSKKLEDVRTAVITYLEDPNKVIVPFKPTKE